MNFEIQPRSFPVVPGFQSNMKQYPQMQMVPSFQSSYYPMMVNQNQMVGMQQNQQFQNGLIQNQPYQGRFFNPFENLNTFRPNSFQNNNQYSLYSLPQNQFMKYGPMNEFQMMKMPYQHMGSSFNFNWNHDQSVQNLQKYSENEVQHKNYENSENSQIQGGDYIKLCHEDMYDQNSGEHHSSISENNLKSHDKNLLNYPLKLSHKIKQFSRPDRDKVQKKSQYLIRKEKLQAEQVLKGEVSETDDYQTEGQQLEIKDIELQEIEEEIKEVVELVKRRPKERRIRDVLTLIKLRNSIQNKQKLKYFKDAEKIMMKFGVSMKSFRDYNTELRIAEKFGFEIEQNLDQGFGIIREYNDLLLQENQYPKKKKVRREIRKQSSLVFNREINAIQMTEGAISASVEPPEEQRQKSHSITSNCSETNSTVQLAFSLQCLSVSNDNHKNELHHAQQQHNPQLQQHVKLESQ